MERKTAAERRALRERFAGAKKPFTSDNPDATDICQEGKNALRGKSLERAWATCSRGCWLAWWLRVTELVDLDELRTIANDCGVSLCFSDSGRTPEHRTLARELRRRFTAYGERRV